METKKHNLANKKVTAAVQTFTQAAKEIEKANHLIMESIKADEQKLTEIENTIRNLENAFDLVQANIISKKGEVKSNEALAEKLKEFTV